MADRVSEALRRLRARFGEAEAHVDATQARARKASARRLRELLAGPPAARVAGLNDASLTPADRAELESAVAQALPRRHVRVRRSLTGAGRRLMRHVRYRRRGLITLVLLVTPALGLARTMSAHTLADAAPVRLTTPYAITWTLAGGQRLRMDEPKEAEFVWFQRDGKSYLRRWFDGRGYGEVMVSNDFTRTAITLRP
ncbi:MAG: hypothetical protein K2Y56_25100 [Methylobacterium sp.]|uniref:hypothetical protein n=1 Tax=Methylobacterium sp. TaxID=409 RepID=UPI0025D747F7|nr:hypothetical protein [Methylobacterium sp.]MBX9934749.1 hypothetical protein [Methylobacterium sp.]